MRRRRRLWIAWAALPVLLLACDTLYWAYVTRQLDAGFRAWIASRRGAGWTVQAAPAKIGGWPAAATLTAADVTLAGGAAAIPGGLRWRTQRLELRIPLLHPRTLHVIPGGTQHLRIAHGAVIPFTGARIEAALPLRAGLPPQRLRIRADQVRVRLRAGGQATDLTVGALDARLRLHPDAARGRPVAAFAIRADAVTLPPGLHWAFGPTIARVVVDGALDGPLRPAGDVTARAVAWRNGGGALRVRRFGLRWGPLNLSGTALLALDQQLQPTGTGTAQVAGYAASLDALTADGVLSRSAAIAAKAVLSLMAHPATDGHPAEVTVPLSLQHRTVSVQRMPLLRLPVLDWPGR